MLCAAFQPLDARSQGAAPTGTAGRLHVHFTQTGFSPAVPNASLEMDMSVRLVAQASGPADIVARTSDAGASLSSQRYQPWLASYAPGCTTIDARIVRKGKPIAAVHLPRAFGQEMFMCNSKLVIDHHGKAVSLALAPLAVEFPLREDSGDLLVLPGVEYFDDDEQAETSGNSFGLTMPRQSVPSLQGTLQGSAVLRSEIRGTLKIDWTFTRD